uniref:Cytochrome b5 heme-binding domain-containing protein n=1 Tax=Fundulus heteroclitus TaxID=8078 RepID=A0A3Q2QPP4_FUNHE
DCYSCNDSRAIKPISQQRNHNKREDCWICIQGLVYNVTPYMDYHPGGEEELMKAAGIEGTDRFDQVHRWVNYESMLKECLVGRMATKVATPAKSIIPPPSPSGLLPILQKTFSLIYSVLTQEGAVFLFITPEAVLSSFSLSGQFSVDILCKIMFT